jgi:hypothetical protein
MKSLSAAALTFALLTAPAHAQGMPGGPGAMPGSDATSGGKHRKGTGQKTQEQEKKQPKVDDKEYRSAIDRLPDQKFDPWRNTRWSASRCRDGSQLCEFPAGRRLLRRQGRNGITADGLVLALMARTISSPPWIDLAKIFAQPSRMGRFAILPQGKEQPKAGCAALRARAARLRAIAAMLAARDARIVEAYAIECEAEAGRLAAGQGLSRAAWSFGRFHVVPSGNDCAAMRSRPARLKSATV